MDTRARVSILKKFFTGATAPVNTEAAILPPASAEIDFNWPTLGDVMAADQSLRAACERAVIDLERLDDPVLPSTHAARSGGNPAYL